ncbi:MAG: hypothetical protein HY718_13810 [Planctomycetes bacterium]|nr:hypothetical protein [Planctomycetota bacterium]
MSIFGGGDSERWTIRCCRVESPGHAQEAGTLATMLRQVKQLNPKLVRVATDATGSTIYYGEYRRVESKATGQLVFPPEYQRDVEFIRALSYDGVSTPFFTAQPESVDAGPPSAHPEWEATNAKGTHSLLIAVFYNTPTFSERKQAAEQYVELLRQDGFAAYYYHEPVKSFAFVGDFTTTDIVRTPEGPRPGPRVEQMIARREEEFRHFTENGHLRKHLDGSGRETVPFSQVVPMPRKH